VLKDRDLCVKATLWQNASEDATADAARSREKEKRAMVAYFFG
jgi:hypothetical protein